MKLKESLYLFRQRRRKVDTRDTREQVSYVPSVYCRFYAC